MLFTVIAGKSGSGKDTAVDKAEEFFTNKGNWVGLPGVTTMVPPFAHVSDLVTPEGLLTFLMKLEQRPALLSIREFDRLLDRLQREYGLSLPKYLNAIWDGEEHINHPRAKEDLLVVEPTLSLVTTTTPEVLRDKMSREHMTSGFANRMLFVFGGKKNHNAEPTAPDWLREGRTLWKNFADGIAASTFKGATFSLSQEARKHNKAYFEGEFPQLVASYSTPEETSLLERMQAKTLRIAMLFAISDGSRVISGEHFATALVFVRWCTEHTLYEARRWGSDQETRLGDAILDAFGTDAELPMKAITDRIGTYYGSYSMISRTVSAMKQCGVLQSGGMYVVRKV
jgi:hypothetical protein